MHTVTTGIRLGGNATNQQSKGRNRQQNQACLRSIYSGINHWQGFIRTASATSHYRGKEASPGAYSGTSGFRMREEGRVNLDEVQRLQHEWTGSRSSRYFKMELNRVYASASYIAPPNNSGISTTNLILSICSLQQRSSVSKRRYA